ncbi:MAG: alpha-mannosidase [Candidatus Hydrogenedentes bacterium]|nr:alpha-mannosidase [Candidatus Hydrogenedentota bacterium]
MTIHMIGHGHIDPTWLWRWTEGCGEVRATFRSALERMRETPQFTFSASSACFYQWFQNTEPELFEEMRGRIREGRWEIVGGFWVEPDCNIPCGESFVRHGLYSQRYFEKAFGRRVRVGFNPDSFGHTGSLPQILKKLGIDYYMFMRPAPDCEMEYPDGTTFWWQSKDGSRVLASHIPICYSATDVAQLLTALPRHRHLNAGQKHVPGFYGVGNHGGGPTRQAIRAILDAQSGETGPKVVFSTTERYFEALMDAHGPEWFPTISRDLQHHARGCYSAHAWLKRLHRHVEHALMTAERFATAAWLLNARAYPHDQFEKAWKDLLYNQFHDILAGTCLESSYEDTRDQLGAARHRAHVIVNDAIQSIARDIDTSAEGNTIVVINPLTWPVTQPVSVSGVCARGLDAPIHLVDDAEQPVSLQRVRHERPGDCRFVFTAQVPATGYRVYHARGGGEIRKLIKRLDAARNFLENDWWRVEFDDESGHMARLFDKERRIEVLDKGGVPVALVDGSDTWSHDVTGYRVEAGRFGHAQLRLVEHGDVLATVQAVSHWRASTAVQEVTLYRDLPVIDCFLRVNWQEAHCVLKLAFESRIDGGTATYDSSYGHEERDTRGDEEPGRQWFDLTGRIDGLPYGLAVVNDGQYGFDVMERTLRVTLLRSPVYAHHDPVRLDAEASLPVMDQGWHDARLRLIPHVGPWQDARVVKQAWELNVPLMSHLESSHPGTRRTSAQLIGTEADNVLLSVVKQSESGEDLIIRGYETSGRPAHTTLHLPYFQREYELTFAPHEIKTVRIDPRTWTMREVNLLEE